MIEFINLSQASFEKRFFQKIAEAVFKKEAPDKNINLSVVLVDKQRIRELNKKYRQTDKATDVLTFCYDKGEPFVLADKNLLKLKELMLCPEYIKEQAEKSGQDYQKELALAFIHGLLHILGYNHKTAQQSAKMGRRQEYYLSLLFN